MSQTKDESLIDRKAIFVPVLIITVGTGWLLSTIGIAPEIDWVWTLGLATAGILTFVLSGIDKFSVVVGPLLIISSILSVFRQREILSIDIEVPCLVILTGLLILIAQLKVVRSPSWIQESNQ